MSLTNCGKNSLIYIHMVKAHEWGAALAKSALSLFLISMLSTECTTMSEAEQTGGNHQKTASDKTGHPYSVNRIRWHSLAAPLFHFSITSILNILVILGRPVNCNSGNSEDTIPIFQYWNECANMKGQKDPWEEMLL